MASPFQQQSLRRKIVYTVSILVLFSISLALKEMDKLGITAQAQALEIREEDRGAL